jgi:tripartite-type tricarboxylate transporter receptor subunit TctC
MPLPIQPELQMRRLVNKAMFVFCTAPLLWPLLASAQTYPSRAIKIIVPFPPGGTVDSLPRIVGEKLSRRWAQPIVIENRAGAGGNIGAQVAATAPPDGYVLFASSPGPLTTNQFLYKKISYDPAAFVPVSLLGVVPTVLLVRRDLPVRDLNELVSLAKSSKPPLTFASQGNGTTSHLAGILFQKLTNATLLHVPYSGTAAALTALAGGQVDVLFDNATASLALHQSGRIKMLAVAGDTRLERAPLVPTFAQSGLKDFESHAYISLVAPPGTPSEIAAFINSAVDEVLRDPEVKARFAEFSVIPRGGSPGDLSAWLKAETARWKQVIQENRVTID